MEYKIDNRGDDVTIHFQGDITFSENVVFRQMLSELSDGALKKCIFDLSGVGMVDSAGLGMFLIAREKAENGGWKLEVMGAKGHVASMLKLTKLSEILEG